MTSKAKAVRVYGGQTYTEEALQRYKEYQAQYESEKYYQCKFRIREDKDAKLVAHLKKLTEEKRLGPYLRDLIYRDMEQETGNDSNVTICFAQETDKEILNLYKAVAAVQGEDSARDLIKKLVLKGIQ